MNRDEWQQLIMFINLFPRHFDSYDSSASTPVLLDQFVDHVQNGDEQEDESEDDL